MKNIFPFQSLTNGSFCNKKYANDLLNVVYLCLFLLGKQPVMAQTLEAGLIDEGSQDKTKLWYTEPAADWLEALPIGNGRLGAMVFGDVENEQLQLNEESVWAGPPVPENRFGAFESVKKARNKIFQGDYLAADKVIQDNVLGERISPRSYQPLGDLLLNFELAGKPTNYKRELDLKHAIARTCFTVGRVNFTREYFSSAIDNTSAKYRLT